ncbi:tetratricopeptide repeat protein, partial [Candidatus Bathyarchaeota archaeon]|nr:tetratricopeptide repeat protein [Candidatus Bathyarchaeota archaeon]
YKEAITYYEKALSLDPTNPEAWYLRAVVFIETGRNTEALADCEHAIALNQNYADAWSKKGHALYNLERYTDALFACTRALALNGNDASAWYIKGVCLDELGRNDEAQEAYGKSLELEIILDMKAEKKKLGKLKGEQLCLFTVFITAFKILKGSKIKYRLWRNAQKHVFVTLFLDFGMCPRRCRIPRDTTSVEQCGRTNE